MIEVCLVLDDLCTTIILIFIQSQYWDIIPWFLWLCCVTFPGEMGINISTSHRAPKAEQGRNSTTPYLVNANGWR